MIEVVEQLRKQLGDAVSTDPIELDAARADKSGHVAKGTPLAIVHAVDVEQVRATMRIASATGTPVVTRGAGTGLAGGANAGAGEIVLSTLRMTRILEIDVDDEIAVVEPGIINADLNRALAPRGLWWAPDPASRAISTVGGNIATNAGGLLCAKYGVTREAVLGLSVVLADGRLLELGRRTIKGVTGLDVTALMVGSEGVLGVIVGATLKLRRIDASPVSTVAAYFDTVRDAANAAIAVSAVGVRPAIMELLDEPSVTAISDHLGLDVGGRAHLLVQTDGPAAAVEADAVLAVVRDLGGEAELAETAEDGQRLLDFRRSFHAAMGAVRTVLIEDVCVPRSALPAMFDTIAAIGAKYELEIPTIAHAGDGNLHPNFVFEPDPEAEGGVPEHVWQAADELFRASVALGGTLTGEHGVGILKRRWLESELGADQLDLQRRIKSAFDPQGILNPGKVY